ncbi:hypothetical protein [Epibacterium ulvae]|uniref:hypothetical protein n=1 Tax=Epibacterium ulvae TaxID=1156985 RepID=UPI00249084DC|nr:hypothetical protein [Epibacterium ulvae]
MFYTAIPPCARLTKSGDDARAPSLCRCHPGTAEGLLLEFPLAATDPSPVSFSAGWGQQAGAMWPRKRDFLGDLIGALAVMMMPFAFLIFGALQ